MITLTSNKKLKITHYTKPIKKVENKTNKERRSLRTIEVKTQNSSVYKYSKHSKALPQSWIFHAPLLPRISTAQTQTNFETLLL